jgi:hypothetical protein
MEPRAEGRRTREAERLTVDTSSARALEGAVGDWAIVVVVCGGGGGWELSSSACWTPGHCRSVFNRSEFFSLISFLDFSEAACVPSIEFMCTALLYIIYLYFFKLKSRPPKIIQLNFLYIFLQKFSF